MLQQGFPLSRQIVDYLICKRILFFVIPYRYPLALRSRKVLFRKAADKVLRSLLVQYAVEQSAAGEVQEVLSGRHDRHARRSLCGLRRASHFLNHKEGPPSDTVSPEFGRAVLERAGRNSPGPVRQRAPSASSSRVFPPPSPPWSASARRPRRRSGGRSGPLPAG